MIFRFANRGSALQRHPGSRHLHKHSPYGRSAVVPLCDLPQGDHAIIDKIDLVESASEQVMLFGFIPGVEVMAGQSGPGGDPRVYRLDGTEVAIRRDTARHILVRLTGVEEQA